MLIVAMHNKIHTDVSVPEAAMKTNYRELPLRGTLLRRIIAYEEQNGSVSLVSHRLNAK